MFRETSGLVLRIDQLAVDFDIEDAASAFVQLGIHPRLCFDRVRQTDGLRGVVSLHAVRDRDPHDSDSISLSSLTSEEVVEGSGVMTAIQAGQD